MAFNGVRTTDLPPLTGLDGVLGNQGGSTGVLNVDALVALVGSRTGPAYETVAALNADLDWAAGTLATVWGETDAATNGVYQKQEASGAGSWDRIGGLPITALTADLLAGKADTSDLSDLEAQVASVAAGLTPAGAWDASSGAFPASADANDFYVVSTAGTVDGESFAIGDWLIARIDAPSTGTFAANWTRADYAAVVTSTLIDAPVLSVGSAAGTDAQLNTLYVASQGHIGDGDLDYGITIQAFEPGLALIDRTNGAGQSLISGNGGAIRLSHDLVNNDGTIGADTNTDTEVSAIFAPSQQRFFVDGTEQLVLDDTGLTLGGEQVATEQFFDASFEAALAAARPKQVPVSLGSALNINGSQGVVEGTLSSNTNVPAGTWLASFHPALRYNASTVSQPGDTGLFAELQTYLTGTTTDAAGFLMLGRQFWKPEAQSPWGFPVLMCRFTLAAPTALDFVLVTSTSNAIASDVFQVGYGPLFIQQIEVL